MKNEIHKIIVFLFLISGILTSCEDVIDIDLHDKTVDMYAVEAKITTADNPYVFLYKTEKVNHNEPYSGISGASVTISNNSKPVRFVALVEDQENKGYYTVPEGTEYKGKTGEKYTIEINVGSVTLTASDTLKEVAPIDSIQIKPSQWADYLFLGVFIYGNEPAGKGDFYKWETYVDGNLLNKASEMAILNDELVDGNYIYGYEVFTDFHDPTLPGERKLKPGNRVLVKQLSLSQFAYKYFYQLVRQSQTGGLFSVPPANIAGNFTASDGSTVVGLFTAHDVSVSNSFLIDAAIDGQRKEFNSESPF